MWTRFNLNRNCLPSKHLVIQASMQASDKNAIKKSIDSTTLFSQRFIFLSQQILLARNKFPFNSISLSFFLSSTTNGSTYTFFYSLDMPAAHIRTLQHSTDGFQRQANDRISLIIKKFVLIHFSSFFSSSSLTHTHTLVKLQAHLISTHADEIQFSPSHNNKAIPEGKWRDEAMKIRRWREKFLFSLSKEGLF